MRHEWQGVLYWWNFPHWRHIFYCILKLKVPVCWSSLNSKRVLVIVLVGNVLVLVLGTSVLETPLRIINLDLSAIAWSNVMVYRQLIFVYMSRDNKTANTNVEARWQWQSAATVISPFIIFAVFDVSFCHYNVDKLQFFFTFFPYMSADHFWVSQWKNRENHSSETIDIAKSESGSFLELSVYIMWK